jgi:predicted DNA-binding antitoxin AbrB/MazE fold protein
MAINALLQVCRMTVKTEAIYENGVLRPLSPLALPEHARVLLAVDDLSDDERVEWLAQSERRLMGVWDNAGDDVFNDLLTP